MQRKAMTRLMGLQFRVVYRKGKENWAADALSRACHMMAIQAVSEATPQWLQEVLNSYTTDPHAQQLLTQLAVSSPDENGFSLEQGLIKCKGKIWIANNSALQTKLIAAMHSSVIGGHSGTKATYYRIKKLFHRKGSKLMWRISSNSVKSVNRLNMKIHILLVSYNLCLSHKELGRISPWTLWKGCPV
jgi:hypothetical protein